MFLSEHQQCGLSNPSSADKQNSFGPYSYNAALNPSWYYTMHLFKKEKEESQHSALRLQKDHRNKDKRTCDTLKPATKNMPKLVVHLVSQQEMLAVTIPLSGQVIPVNSVQVYDMDGVSSSAVMKVVRMSSGRWSYLMRQNKFFNFCISTYILCCIRHFCQFLLEDSKDRAIDTSQLIT